MILLDMKNKQVKIYFEAWDEVLIVEIPSKIEIPLNKNYSDYLKQLVVNMGV